MSTRSGGVRKRKGTSVAKCRILTRNRSKVERLRESLNDLHLTGSKTWKNPSSLHVSLHDFQYGNRISDQGSSAGFAVPTYKEIPLGGTILKRNSCGMHSRARSDMKKVTFDISHEFGMEESQWHTSGEMFQSDNPKSVTAGIRSPSGMPPWDTGSGNDFFSSISTGRKCGKEPFYHAFEPLKSFKGTRDHGNDDDDRGKDKVQASPSPPNSPLYDMPPPSTLAQKQERRAKRNLQLERWRKYEASKSRQERHERRQQGTSRTAVRSVLDSRHVQWSNILVQTVYIDDVSE